MRLLTPPESVPAPEARRGRPKSQEKKAAILHAAAELFLRQGLQSTSMDTVAQDAGVSKQTVYSHFANKDELFAACIHAKLRQHDMEPGHTVKGLAIRDDLTEVSNRFTELVTDPEVVSMFRLIVAESATYPHIAELFYRYGSVPTIHRVVEVIRAGVERGEIEVAAPQDVAERFLQALKGHIHFKLLLNLTSSPSRAELRRHVKICVNEFMYCHGVRD